jgi:hypothetical protein
VVSQTDIEFMGWAWSFPSHEGDDPDWRQVYAEAHKKWLETWNPPEEWMQ